MKSYTTIPKWKPEDFGKYVHGFYKIDGSNFRAEWNRKLSKKSNFTAGFNKFGTRNEVINKNNSFFEGVDIFDKKFAIELDQIFSDNKIFRGVDRITVYGEFFGDKSFAGIHDWDEPHDIYLYDAFLYKKGYLSPSEFVKAFDEVECCERLFQGVFDETILKQVEDNIVPATVHPRASWVLEEGVVFKGVEEGKVFMFKVKTNEWLNKVKELYGEKRMAEY